MRWLTLILALSACAPAQGPEPTGEIDEAFTVYVEGFRQNTSQWRENLTIVFGQPTIAAGGQCFDTGVIFVYQPDWDILNPCYRERLFLHEMGHCVFGYVHGQNSFMDQGYFGLDACLENREQNFKDFFRTDNPILYQLPRY